MEKSSVSGRRTCTSASQCAAYSRFAASMSEARSFSSSDGRGQAAVDAPSMHSQDGRASGAGDYAEARDVLGVQTGTISKRHDGGGGSCLETECVRESAFDTPEEAQVVAATSSKGERPCYPPHPSEDADRPIQSA